MPKHPVTALIMATLLEAEPFIKALALQEEKGSPCPTYHGENLVLFLSGLGKANAAMATTCACLKIKPDWIYNLGAAGALKDSLPLGSIYHITKVIDPDRPDLISGAHRVHNPQTLAGFHNAVLATHDRPIKTLTERRKTARYADLCDMEGAAVVQIAGQFATPCLLFKFVSDTPAPGEEDRIIQRIKEWRTPFCDFFLDRLLPLLF